MNETQLTQEKFEETWLKPYLLGESMTVEFEPPHLKISVLDNGKDMIHFYLGQEEVETLILYHNALKMDIRKLKQWGEFAPKDDSNGKNNS